MRNHDDWLDVLTKLAVAGWCVVLLVWLAPWISTTPPWPVWLGLALAPALGWCSWRAVHSTAWRRQHGGGGAWFALRRRRARRRQVEVFSAG